jgi:hypothetical protein
MSTTIWKEQKGAAARGQRAYAVKSGGRYSITTDPDAADASFVTDSGDSRLKIQDSVQAGSLLGYLGAGRRLTILSAPTV